MEWTALELPEPVLECCLQPKAIIRKSVLALTFHTATGKVAYSVEKEGHCETARWPNVWRN
jgi:hypothetical protein